MRQFLKQTFASLIGSLFSLIIFLGLGTTGLLLLIIALASRDTGPQVQDKSVLVFDLSVNITDNDPVSTTSEALTEAISGEEANSITLRAVLDTLEAARQDKRIQALYLDGSRTVAGNNTGWATLTEVRSALERFRAADKPIIFYDVTLGEKEYYLGSTSNEIVLNPMGVMEFNGFASEQIFFKEALEKLGIGVQIVRVGKYKSAVEPFILQQLSPESREQIQQLLSDVWGELLAKVGKSRQMNSQQLQAIADSQGILMAADARQRGLVDKVAYFDEVVAQLKKLTGDSKEDKSFRQISLNTYAKVASQDSKQSTSNNKIALVYAEGEIVNGQGNVQQVGGERFARQIRQLRLDKNVKAVVLRVNSPGGSATASEVIQREVRLTRKQKPVIVSMGNVAASGGYWISTYSDRIFAQPNTVTGSIGVFGLLPNLQELANENGITWDIVKTGNFADISSINRPKTEQELAVYQKMVNQTYNQFLDKVAESRKLPKPKVAEIAQGRVWSGIDAKELGLVDEIGGLDDAIAYAAKQAELGSDWKVQEYPEVRSLEERIVESLTGQKSFGKDQLPESLNREFQKLQDNLAILKGMNDPRNVYARLPFNWRLD
ncbi:MAG: signal peptide peptidase SppA [Symploca sp. SIO3C6]|nr:signal peptide peptidase SppA [Symploca sp. SIO3C6]NET04509.1 signal peptide peptidase SppA [Symploca sp. SIO2B6]